MALLHHPDRNGGSGEATERFREVKAAYGELRHRARAQQPSVSPGDAARHSRNLDPAAVERVRTRLDTLNELIRVAIADPTDHKIAAVVDTARWARLDVDSALALKGHVADLRDAHWTTLRYAGWQGALATFAAFIEAPVGSLNLVARPIVACGCSLSGMSEEYR